MEFGVLTIDTDATVLVPDLSERARQLHSLCQEFVAVDYDRATLDRVKYLRRVETEAAYVAVTRE